MAAAKKDGLGVWKVTVDGTVFPPIDMDDLSLGERAKLESHWGVKFDDDGDVTAVNFSGLTIAAIYLAWKRADPAAATVTKVENLHDSQFDVEKVEDPTGAAEGGQVVTLEQPGRQLLDGSMESDRGSSTVSA